MKKNTRILNLVLIFIISIGCGIPASNPDKFYSAWVDWGVPRFPLIKPYDVSFLGKNENWVIALHSSPTTEEMMFYTNIYDVKKIAVDNGVVMIYSPYQQHEVDAQKVLNWFVLIPDNEIEAGFDNENDFLEYVQEYEIEDIAWQNPEDINRIFLDTGCLDWIPLCE